MIRRLIRKAQESKRAAQERQEKEAELKMLYHIADRERLLADILSIKRDIDFKPKYVIPPLVSTVCERPLDFKGGFEQWFHFMRDEHRKTIQEKIDRKIQKESFQLVMEIAYKPYVMRKMMQLI